MLGYTVAGETGLGAGDRLIGVVAGVLLAKGWRLAGVVQSNTEGTPGRACLMDLTVLGSGERVRISQDLGTGSRGCRLDPAGLEAAVGLVERSLASGPRLLIVNKFGKQEAEGRGFRPLIGRALAEGVPVLTTVSAKNLAAFEGFAGGMGERLAPGEGDVLDWCRRCAT